MSLDRNLREALRREAAGVEPDVARSLRAVELRATHRGGLGLPTLLVAATAIAIVVALRVAQSPPGVGVGGPASPASPAAAPSQSGQLFAQIAGAYRLTLDGSTAAVRDNALAGDWTMRLTADGVIELTPPASFTPGQSGMSGFAFSLAGNQFRTNLFYTDYCLSVGTYTWTLSGGRLTFASATDTCSIRQALLATQPWTAVQ